MSDVVIGNNKLMFGNCLEGMKEIPDNSVDMVLCDLPYGTTQCKWDSTLDLKALWKQYKRVAKSDAAIVLFAQTPFDKVLGYSNLDILKYEWIWEKTAATGHLNAKKMPMKAHENILVFYEKTPTYNPQKTFGHVRKTSKAEHKEGCKESDVYQKGQKHTTYDSTERYPRSVLEFKSDKQKVSLHPTQKPVALVEYLINTYSNLGDIVLDNTMGSGTTGVACTNTNRNFIGIEMDEGYYNIAKGRITESVSGMLEAA